MVFLKISRGAPCRFKHCTFKSTHLVDLAAFIQVHVLHLQLPDTVLCERRGRLQSHLSH